MTLIRLKSRVKPACVNRINLMEATSARVGNLTSSRNRQRIRKQSRNTWHLSKCSRLEEFKLVHQKSSSHVERKNYAIKKSVSHKKRATKSIFKGFCCPFYASRFQVTAISIEYCISGKLAKSLSPVCQKHFCGVNFSWKQIVKCRSFEICLPHKEHFSNMHLHGFFFRSESGCNFKNKATLGFLIIHYFDVLSFFLSWNPLMEK